MPSITALRGRSVAVPLSPRPPSQGQVTRILATRTRLPGNRPRYAYRTFVPLEELSTDRQDLIPNRSDYGVPPGPWARLDEVIAPIEHLRLDPGKARCDGSRQIRAAAQGLDAALLRHIYPEMTETPVPLIFTADQELPDKATWTVIGSLTGRFDELRDPAAQVATAETIVPW